MADKNNLTIALKKYFGFDKFKGDQESIICNLLDGNGSQTGLDLRHLQQKSHRNDYCDYTDHRQP